MAAQGFSHVIFGDIFLDDHKAWVERVCTECDLAAVEPLWGIPTDELFSDFIGMGGRALIVATRAAVLDATWLSRPLDLSMLPELQALGVDPCGERGEYHTLVVSFPGFRSVLSVREVGRLLHDGYWMLDVVVED